MTTLNRLSYFLLLIILSACGSYQPVETYPPSDNDFVTPNELSQQFLRTLKAGGNAGDIVNQYAALDPSVLAAALDTREKKLAFWVNTYNGMVQYLLVNNPEYYDQRDEFFKTPRFTVAGHELSPNEMEHGIIRGGENRLGLGFIPAMFQNKFERTFKVSGGDARVHFALNCGAADCPPVEIYKPETYNQQIDARAKAYLADHSEIKTEDGEEVLYTSPLFSWFRGDFRQYDGIDDFLVEFDVVPAEKKGIKREYTDYDWTLQTGIWAE